MARKCKGSKNRETLVSGACPGNALWSIRLTIALAFVAIAPLWLVPIDFWDGRVIDYAMSIGDLRGLRVWFYESRWFLQYWLYAAIHELGDLSGITSHRWWFAAIASAAILGIARETYHYGRLSLRQSRPCAILAGRLALFFPPWHTLMSSCLLIHAMCVWFLVLGYRLTRDLSWSRRGIGLALIVISFQLNSIIAMLAGLCVAECLLERIHDRKVSKETWWRSGLLTAIAISAFIILKQCFPAYGEFEGYNRIVAFDSLHDMLVSVRLLGRYCAWIAVVLAFSFAGFLSAMLVGHFNSQYRGGLTMSLRTAINCFGRNCARDGKVPLVLVLLFAVGTAPYIAVHKYAKFASFDDWSQRNAYVLCVPLCLLGSWLVCQLVVASHRASMSKRLANVMPAIVTCGFASLLYLGYSEKIERSSFELGLIRSLKLVDAPPAGAVHFQTELLRGVALRPYEVNWLLWRAYGRMDWLGEIGPKGETQKLKLTETIETILKRGDEMHRLEFLLPSYRSVPCHTEILVTGEGLTKVAAWAWLFQAHPQPQLTVTTISSACAIQ